MAVRPAYYLVSSLNWFAAVLPMSVMVLLAQARGLSLSQIGLFVGIYSLTIALCELPSGAIADTFGRKRTVLASYGLALVAKLLFLLAFDLQTFIAYAVVWGLARALGSGALEAWFIDGIQAQDPEADVQQALARAGTFNLIGLATGTLAGSALPGLFRWLPADGTAVLTPLSTTLVASIACGTAVLVLTGLLVHENRSLRGAPVLDSLRLVLRDALGSIAASMAAALSLTRTNGRLRALLGAEFAVGLALTASETFWQPFFAERLPAWAPEGLLGALTALDGGKGPAADGSSGTLVFGLVLAGCFGAGIIGNLLATPLARLLRRRYALLAGLFQLQQGAMFVILALQTNLLLATAFLWLSYLTRSTWSSPHAALYNREVPSTHRSVMLSVLSLASFAGAFFGSVVLGPVAQATTITMAWLMAGAALVATSLLYLGLDSPRPAHSPQRGTELSSVVPK